MIWVSWCVFPFERIISGVVSAECPICICGKARARCQVPKVDIISIMFCHLTFVEECPRLVWRVLRCPKIYCVLVLV